MSIIHSSDSEYAKERIKHEAQRTEFGPGLRPYTWQEYPKMLYKAGRSRSGVPVIVDSYEVDSPTQEANLNSRGYVEGQDHALKALHDADHEVAVLAANRAYTDRSMSPQAQAEAAAYEASTSAHVAEIPATPIRRSHKKQEAT